MRTALLRVQVKIIPFEPVNCEHRCIPNSQTRRAKQQHEREDLVAGEILNPDVLTRLRDTLHFGGIKREFCVSRIFADPRTTFAEFALIQLFSAANRKDALTRSSFLRAVRGRSCQVSRKSRRAFESSCFKYRRPFVAANCSRCFKISLYFLRVDSPSLRPNSASLKKRVLASAIVISCADLSSGSGSHDPRASASITRCCARYQLEVWRPLRTNSSPHFPSTWIGQLHFRYPRSSRSRVPNSASCGGDAARACLYLKPILCDPITI